MSTIQNNGIKKDESNVIYGPFKEIPEIDGIGTTLFKYMKRYENSVAQIDAVTGKKETYGELLDRCIKTSIYMKSLGIKPNDIVSICSYNHLDTFVPIAGAFFIGAVVACTDPKLSVSETVYLLDQIRPKIVFVSVNAIDLIEQTLKNINVTAKIIVFGKSEKYAEFQTINSITIDDQFVPYEVKNTKDTAVITFSSGTTGLPKGVCLSHFGLLGPTKFIGNSESRVILTSSTPYWISAFVVFINSVIANSTRIVIREFDENEIWNWITTYKVSEMILAPSHVIALTKKGCPENANVNSVKLIFTGGSKISEEQLLKIRSLFSKATIYYGYGLTETTAQGLSLMPLDDPMNRKIYQEKPNCIGRPQPYCTYKVVDVDTEEKLGPNQTGELRIKTVFHMNGYYNCDSSNSWDSEGFIKTGDLVQYDEDLNFYYVDRIKEMLKYRSWQISPALLENVILDHPAVKNVVVIGQPDPEDGDHPLAIIETMKPTSEEEIQNFVNQRVADTHRLRGGIKFVDQIPVSVTGKNRRGVIKDLLNDKHIQ